MTLWLGPEGVTVSGDVCTSWPVFSGSSTNHEDDHILDRGELRRERAETERERPDTRRVRSAVAAAVNKWNVLCNFGRDASMRPCVDAGASTRLRMLCE